MRVGLLMLCLAYVLSQFFRAFLAVLSEVLRADIGAAPDDLALASGVWFIVFAAMQIPVGWALDRIGPRRTAAALLFGGGGGGAALFALATTPAQITVAMGLIGVGCSPVLMASYYIFAKEFPPARFATLAALMLGVGSVGNLVASYPMAWAAEVIGWRASLFALSGISVAVAAGILGFVRDPVRLVGPAEGSLIDLLKMPVIWLLLPMMLVSYAPAAAIRGLWIGPYLGDVFGLSTTQIGQATLVMGLAMITGTLAYGPLDRVFGTRKWVVLTGNALCAAALVTLAAVPDHGLVLSVALLALIGLLSGSFPVIIAHGRGFFPPHLVGRGVTLLNLFGIGGAGLMQFVSGQVHWAAARAHDPAAAYAALFWMFGLALAAGVAFYAFSRDNMD